MDDGGIGQASAVAEFRAPLYVAWELTHRCNVRCVHCYSDSEPAASVAEDLSTESALAVVDQVADAGVLVLAFSGGEPLLRHDWPHLVQRAVTRGLSVNIGTNGWTLTSRLADQIKAAGVASVTVSIDSHVPEVHDAFRGRNGLLVRATRAVERLVAAGLRVVVGFTPTRLNFQHGPAVIELARSLGASAVNLSEYVPAGRGAMDLCIRPDELRGVLEEWIRLRERHAGSMDVLWHDCRVGMLVGETERRKYVGCGAGRLVARIRPDGTVTPCVFLPDVVGRVPEQTFDEIWRTSRLMQQFRERDGHVTGNCGGCEHLQSCGGCRAVARAYSAGDPLAGDPHCWIHPGEVPDVPLRRLAAGEGLPV